MPIARSRFNATTSYQVTRPSFVIYGATATSFWRFRQYNLMLPGHEYLKTYRQMNLIADQVHDMPVDDFFDYIQKRVVEFGGLAA